MKAGPAVLLGVRDFCKLHIVIHYVAKLLGPGFQALRSTYSPSAEWGRILPGRQVVKEMTEAGIDTRLVHATQDHPTLFSACFQYPDGAGATSPLATPLRRH